MGGIDTLENDPCMVGNTILLVAVYYIAAIVIYTRGRIILLLVTGGHVFSFFGVQEDGSSCVLWNAGR